MDLPSIKFKKMLFSNEKIVRTRVLYSLTNWLQQQISVDPLASACYNSIQEAYQVNSWADDTTFKNHHLWFMMPNHDSCVSFQQIVKSRLGVPQKNITNVIKDLSAPPRKCIPKKIRGECWKIQFGESTRGCCFCCKKDLDVFDDWHAGHIVSHSNGGPDTPQNLRPLCGSCNLAMGTENMDSFKLRYYPN